jgi:hypothetical protein
MTSRVGTLFDIVEMERDAFECARCSIIEFAKPDISKPCAKAPADTQRG